jgi:hypothetical protein
MRSYRPPVSDSNLTFGRGCVDKLLVAKIIVFIKGGKDVVVMMITM